MRQCHGLGDAVGILDVCELSWVRGRSTVGGAAARGPQAERKKSRFPGMVTILKSTDEALRTMGKNRGVERACESNGSMQAEAGSVEIRVNSETRSSRLATVSKTEQGGLGPYSSRSSRGESNGENGREGWKGRRRWLWMKGRAWWRRAEQEVAPREGMESRQ